MRLSTLLWLSALALGCDEPSRATSDAGAPGSNLRGSASGEGSAAPGGTASGSVPGAKTTTSAAPPPSVPAWKRLADTWVHPNPIPNFELVNHRGERFRLRDLGDGFLLVGLIFTTCSVATACPLTTQKMFDTGKLWKQAEAAGRTEGKALRLLTLTIDPENDTPEVLAAYGEVMLRELPDWTFATGEVELLEEALPRIFGVIAKDDPTAGKAHTVRAALLGPGLQPRAEWKDNSFEPQAILDLILN